jgi:hypothetical protein
MASVLRLSNVFANAGVDAACALANTGYIRIYNGTQPADPQTAPGATLLAELRFNAAAFGASALGVAIAAAIADCTDAAATGAATWFRALKSDGTTPLFDGSAGATSGFDLNLNSAAIQIHAKVSVTSMTFSWPRGY